ncbi:MAG: ATP-binding protein [Burkholderiales bacterium]
MTENTDRYAQQVRAEQIRSVYLQSPTTTIGSLVAGGLLVVTTWNHVPKVALIAWGAALCVHQVIRVYHYRQYMRASPAEREDPRWGRLYTIAAATAGCIWGSAGVIMFVPGSVAHQSVLSLILFGIAAVSMTSLSAYAPAFYLLIPLTLIPLLVRQLMDVGIGQIYLVAPGVIVLAVALSFGRNVNRVIAEAIRKRFENLELIEQLSRQKAVAEKAQHEAETANRSKTQFFAAASHDLRQPLHAMGLFAGALHERIKDPEVLNVVNSINASVAALEGLFNELLDISKIDSGIITPHLSDFPIGSVLGTLLNEFRAEAREKGLELTVVGSRRFVHSDPVLLERILRNLISNAIRYTREGGVLLGCRWRRDRVRIEVRDTGPGIPEDQQGRIFDEFYQLENPGRTSKKGLGLGLSIVRRMSNLLGYRIELRSRMGRGTVFGFDVPVAEKPVVPSAPVPSEKEPAQDLQGRLIVVIDDEEAIVEGMRILLGGWGAEVIGSLTGDDVIAAVEQCNRIPDLIIADYRLAGGIIGTDVINRLRQELDPEIPAILVTGSTAPDRISEADARRYQLLLKPVQPARLRGLIDETLRKLPQL